jgi:RHS repeat-associated protein
MRRHKPQGHFARHGLLLLGLAFASLAFGQVEKSLVGPRMAGSASALAAALSGGIPGLPGAAASTAAAGATLPGSTPDAAPADPGVQVVQGSPAILQVGPVAPLAPLALNTEGVVTVTLPADPSSLAHAYLAYDLEGLSGWPAAVRSINGHPPQGFGAQPASGSSFQLEEIDPSWLRRGINRIRFTAAHAEAMPDAPVAEWRNQGVGDASGDASSDAAAATADAAAPPADIVPYTVRDARLVLVEDSGRTAAAGIAAGRPWDGTAPLDLQLDRPSRPFALEIAAAEPLRGTLTAEATLDAGATVPLGDPIDLGALGPGRHLLPLPDGLPAVAAVRITWASSEPDPGGRGGTITAVALLSSPAGPRRQPRLVLTHPPAGDAAAEGAYLRGFADAPAAAAGPPTLRVNGMPIPGGVAADGSLGVLVPRPPGEEGAWDLHLDLSWPDGTRLIRILHLGLDAADAGGPGGGAAGGVPGAGPNATPAGTPRGAGGEVEREAAPDRAQSLAAKGALLEVPAGAVTARVKLSMRPLATAELPALGAGMTNVTPAHGGFRLGPHGQRFVKPVRLTLPFDAALLPKGLTADDVHTYFFDRATGRWVRVTRLSVASGSVVSSTDHFTDFINATLVLPDEPSSANYTPNSLDSLAKADPAAEIGVIEPPLGGPGGDAELRYPLTVPPGRLGLQPNLALTYNSGAGESWLGVGWDLQLPSIEVSTLFGVPRYDPATETETYAMGSEQFAPVANLASPAPRQAEQVFTRRSEGGFERIVRHGGDPTSFWWEVTDKNGVRSQYGMTPQARLADAATGNTFRWLLEHTIDLHGNSVDYTYFQDSDPGTNGEPWVQVYPAAVSYTGAGGSGGFYRVQFTIDDGQQRPDRTSTGRPGFKVVTRRRLNRVDVLAGPSLVRSYLLTYQRGDFDKSLLAAVAVTAQDGSTVLAQHQFTYQHANAAFGATETWGGMSASSDSTHSIGAAGGAHFYAGLGPPECIPLVGIQVGGTVGGDFQKVSFVDVNGDGLPDRLDDQGNLELNQQGSFQDVSGTGLGSLGHTLNWSFDLTAGARAPAGISVDASFVWSHANDDKTLIDINGDGFPDLVDASSGFSTQLNTGTSFLPAAPWGGFGASGLSLAVAGEESDVLSALQLADPLRKLVLPFAGAAVLDGAIQKSQPGGDGVTVTIVQNGTQLWQRAFAAADTAPCVPAAGGGCGAGGLPLQVQAGDRLYLLADSIRDTSADDLLWTPRVTYTAGDPTALEPWGTRVWVFDGGADFRLGGNPGVPWMATAAGTAQVAAPFVKQPTSDDVTLTVVQNGNTAAPVYQRTFHAADQGTFDEVPPVAVAAKDTLSFQVSSATPVDPALVQWTPQVSVGGANPQPAQPAQVLYVIPQLAPASQPTVSWPAPAAGGVNLHLAWTPSGSGPATLYVQGVQSLLSSSPLPAAAATFDLTVQAVNAGDPLFVTVLGQGGSSAGTLAATDDNGNAIPVNNRFLAPASSQALSGGWHGWYYGEWNGNMTFSEAGLTPPQTVPQSSASASTNFRPAFPSWQGVSGFASPAWAASGFDLYMAAQGMKPSRQGSNAAGSLDQSTGAASAGSGGSGGGLDVVRKTWGHTLGIAASAGASLNLTTGDSETQVDLIDMNGDRYPDQVSAAGVRFSDGHSGFGPLQPFPGLGSAVRRSEDGNVSLTIGLGPIFSQKAGNGKVKAILSSLPTVGSSVSVSQTRYELIDVNGDGLPDLVSMNSGAGAMTVQLNLGYRFGAAEQWPLPAWNTAAGGGPGSCTDLVDFVSSAIGQAISNLSSPNAISFTRSSALDAGIAIDAFGGGASTTLARTLVDLVDVNGDGLPDHVSKEQGEDFFRVKLNHGDGWDPEQLWPVPSWSTSLGDGFVIPGALTCLDALSFSGTIAANASLGFADCIQLVPPVPVVGLQLEISGQVDGSDSGDQLFFQDLDGDGLPDHVLKKRGDPNVYVKRNLATQSNLLIGVARPLGASFTLSYRRQGNFVGPSPDGTHRIDMPDTQWVLAGTTLNDGRGNSYTSAYEYFNDAFYDRSERERYGYARVRTTRPDGSTIDRHYLNQDLYQRQLVVHEELADASGRLFRAEDTAYQLRSVAPSSFFPARVQEQVSFYEGTGTAGKTNLHTYDYDSLGNVIAFQDTGDQGPAGTAVASASYFVDPQSYVVKPSQLTVRDGSGNLLRQRQATYNAQGDLASLQQTLSGGKDPASGSPYSGAASTWTFSYDALGNLASAVDPSGFTSTYTYDPVAQIWPAQVTDSFGYTTAYSWNLLYGKPAATVDENGQTVARTYDAFGRLASVIGPNDSAASPALAFEYYPAAGPPMAVVHQKDVTRSVPIDTVVFADGIGRTIQTKESAELDQGSGTATQLGMRVSGVLGFDALGRVASEGQPVFDTSPENAFVAVAAKNPTLLAYDVLDRIVQASYPQGAVTRMSYGFASLGGAQSLAHTRTDPNGRATVFYDDVRGNLLGVQQTSAGAPRLTRYAYDALSELTAVTDARGNVTSMQYDTLGHRVLRNSPDGGQVELRYTPAGDLGAKVTANLAARGQQIRYQRTFHRLDQVVYPDIPPTLFTWGGPGAPGNTADRIAAVSDESGVEQFTYGRLGEVVQSVRTPVALNGTSPKGPFTTLFQYDSFNRLLSLTYPDGEQLNYAYDASGQVKRATGTLAGVPYDYLHFQGYDEFGQRVRALYGNGVQTVWSYDPLSRHLAGISTTEAGGRPIQALSYQRDLTGTILGLANGIPQGKPSQLGGPVTETFSYDDLYELTAAAGSLRTPPNKVSAFTLALAYDPLGNILSKNQAEQDQHGGGGKGSADGKNGTYDWTYAYAGPQPHAPTQVGDRVFRYDLDGNQVEADSTSNGTRRTLAWDSEDRLAAVADNGQTTSFLYNSDGIRTNKAGQGGETLYINQWFSVTNGNKVTKHVFADDQRVASKQTPPEKVYFYHADHLGSTQYLTDQTGDAYEHLEYFPPGEVWQDDGPGNDVTTFLFSGKELDEETGLAYFGARYYDPRQQQWISADPVLDGLLDVGQVAKPDLTEQPFRLPGLIFGYVSNDPVDLTDPDGLTRGISGKLSSLELGEGGGSITATHDYITPPAAAAAAGAAPAAPGAAAAAPAAKAVKTLTSVNAHITKANLDRGTDVNPPTRKYARMLGGNHGPPTTDDAGHSIACRLGGPGKNPDFIFPQSPNINRGQFSRFEAKVYAKVLKHGAVDVEVTLFYGSNETRPFSIDYAVHYTPAAGKSAGIEKSFEESFDNP